ncbi:MAG: hypothetical protein NT171_10250 [Planctomycetota bacterium]|nr:hypothetical protein [Planctomycetota bacterium]
MEGIPPAATLNPYGAAILDEMDRAGIERQAYSPKNTTISDSGGAESGALPDDLAHVIEAWGSLTADDRRRIRAIVDGRQA